VIRWDYRRVKRPDRRPPAPTPFPSLEQDLAVASPTPTSPSPALPNLPPPPPPPPPRSPSPQPAPAWAAGSFPQASGRTVEPEDGTVCWGAGGGDGLRLSSCRSPLGSPGPCWGDELWGGDWGTGEAKDSVW
jgi:hypothetical protein